MKVLLFDNEVYERATLSALDKKELLDLALQGGYDTMVLELSQLQELINDDAINVHAWWVFFIDRISNQ